MRGPEPRSQLANHEREADHLSTNGGRPSERVSAPFCPLGNYRLSLAEICGMKYKGDSCP